VLFAEKPSTVAGHGFTTGWIPKLSFERPMQPTRMKIGMGNDGLGCAAARLPENKRDAAMMVDDFEHEHATCYNVKSIGLVVITSCGHRGVVNSLRAAIQASGVSKVHAVIGGFHLMPMPEDYARETVRELARFEPDCIIPMHCTGLKFYEAAKEALPGKVLLTSTGTRFTFGSTASASS
jgi:7,8-dihydropterin-6-yl-methyl-4-(beta-D-ribofuranosyl)aminobenzene 5'-phosphate synthase